MQTTTFVDDMEARINNNTLNLKIISALNKDDKLSISEDNNISIENNDFTQCIRRWWNSQTRTQSLDQIESVINEAFNITDIIFEQNKSEEIDNKSNFKEENSSILQRYLIELTSVNKGLDNLKITYKDDVTITSRVDILKQRIDIRTTKLNNILVIKK